MVAPYRSDRVGGGGGRAVDLLVGGAVGGGEEGGFFFGRLGLGLFLCARFIDGVGHSIREELLEEGHVHVRARARVGRGVAGGGGAHREEERSVDCVVVVKISL